jgi:hypothetical protein
MRRQFSLAQLAEGIRERNVKDEDARLVEKWGRTGLLKNLAPRRRSTMARLLENQMAQILRESNALSTGGGSMSSSGQIRGFSNIAFPIVRKVFGGLVANELVSIQPMSLPSGLLFYLDYTYGSNVGGHYGPDGAATAGTDATYARGTSIYGNPLGRGVESGSLAAGGMYDLVGHGFSKVHTGSVVSLNNDVGHFGGTNGAWVSGSALVDSIGATGSNGRWLRFDPDIVTALDQGTYDVAFMHISASTITTAIAAADLRGSAIDQLTISDIGTTGGVTAWGSLYQDGSGVLNLRRLNKRGTFNGVTFTEDAQNGTHVQFVLRLADGGALPSPGEGVVRLSAMLRDQFDVSSADGTALTIPSFESNFGSPPSAQIPEIDIKIEAVPVTADTRKLRARWTPELAQDLNAYHSMDAEVELTQILSQQIALEIDREILGDLIRQANGAVRYWSRMPGKFVDKTTGAVQNYTSTLATGPSFTGTIAEWYAGLIETIIDAANEIQRKTLRGSANFIVTSPDVCTILESSVMYKPSIKFDGSGQAQSAPFIIGAEAIGTVSSRFTVYKDPFFPRNRILVGYKGGSYLETGYVYAPYVPLIVTPTIYGIDDFTPRKGVMTRYGKKMVRSDFYGVVTVLDMNVI